MLTTCKIDPEKREGPSLEKKLFQLFRPKFGLKMGGGGGGAGVCPHRDLPLHGRI